MKFLQNGFDRNWNEDTSYLEMLEIAGKRVYYRWSEKLERETSIPIEGADHLGFPEIVARTVRVEAGHENRAPNLTNKQTPYFALHIDFECVNSTTIDATGPDDIDLPRKFWVEVRLYLDSLGGSLFSSPEILTNLKLVRACDVGRGRHGGQNPYRGAAPSHEAMGRGRELFRRRHRAVDGRPLRDDRRPL
jgi:hypothetical protein